MKNVIHDFGCYSQVLRLIDSLFQNHTGQHFFATKRISCRRYRAGLNQRVLIQYPLDLNRCPISRHQAMSLSSMHYR